MKILIADDEHLARERLRTLLAQIGDIDVVAEAANGREAVELAAQHRPQAVLLDIAMPVLDGLEAARHLADFDDPPAVIFCTAFDDHALAAFEARAIDYLVKPIRRERLAQALERAQRLSGERADALREDMSRTRERSHLCAKLRGSIRMIAVEDILYLQAEDKYTVVHHRRGADLVEDSLRQLEQEFGARFVRIHRNCLVALERVHEVRREDDGRVMVRLHDVDVPLEASRRSLPSLRQRIRRA